MRNDSQNKPIALLFLVSLMLILMCSKIDQPIYVRKYIAYTGHAPLSASICLWKDDKRAVYTIAFDDVRASHYLIAAPELAKHKMAGTFNLNTANVSHWNHWKMLAQQGHELASHTVHHVKLTELSDDSIRWELQQSKQIIQAMVPENGPVLSFTNPFGIGDERVKTIVRQYYLSERDNWGLNDSSMTPEQLYDVKGVGVYPPFDQEKLKAQLELALKKRAWILVYFHSITEHPNPNDICQCPLNFFLDHLTFMETKRDSFWIATQRQVAKYILARYHARIELQKIDPFSLKIRIKNTSQGNLSDFIMSVRLQLPQAWVGHHLEIRPENGQLLTRKTKQHLIVLNLKLNQDYFLKSFN